jgi:hypothetical protein
MKKYFIIGGVIVVAAAVLYYFLWKKDQSGNIVIPYIAHQKPLIDPHLPTYNPLADKLDEVLFDGIFNISANPSGITYEDGLGEFIAIDENNIVTIRLKSNKKWHDSFFIEQDDDKIKITEKEPRYFTARDLNFTLKRIQRLGSLSPDYILVSQALERFEFEGPDINDEVRFKFRGDRIWLETDIKEVLSFKILPHNADLNATKFAVGSGPYLALKPKDEVSNHYKNPDSEVHIPNLILAPFIDNSTFSTELSNNNINVLLSTPFGSLSPILSDVEDYFYKSNISTTFFAILLNCQRLNREQRYEIRKLIDKRRILNRFFKIGSEQQRHIADYKGNRDNYSSYINHSVFPSSTYYVDEQVILPQDITGSPNLAVLPDTIRVKACLNYGFREEYRELIEILNDPGLFQGRIRVTTVQNKDIKSSEYDAILLAFTGYRSTFLFDLYDIFLREPDLETYRINLISDADQISPSSFQSRKNFFHLDAQSATEEQEDILKLLEYIYAFMSTREIGDKQAYARFIDEQEHRMALGIWLFSLPSLAYFTTQFDEKTIDLYGVASQLSTIEKWQERKEE